MNRPSHVCVIVWGLMLLLSTPLYAKTPTIAVPRFTVWTIEHQGKVTAKSYTGVSPLGVTEYKKIEVEKLESILKEIEMPVLTDIFIRHLVRNSKFTVLERAKVDKLLGEIRMGEDGLIDQDKIIKKGKMLGADYLVIGAVVQADAGVGYKQVPYTEQYYRIEEGIIRVDLRVIKTASGEILTAQQGDGQVFNKTMVGSMSVNPVSNDFQHDLQEAQATDLTAKIVDVFYPFKVILVKVKTIMANRGQNFEIMPGTAYNIMRRGAPIKDPDTGTVLGREEKIVATAKVIDVQEKLCILEVFEGNGVVMKGDVLRPRGESAQE